MTIVTGRNDTSTQAKTRTYTVLYYRNVKHVHGLKE